MQGILQLHFQYKKVSINHVHNSVLYLLISHLDLLQKVIDCSGDTSGGNESGIWKLGSRLVQ